MIYLVTPVFVLGTSESLEKSERTIDITIEKLVSNSELLNKLGLVDPPSDNLEKRIEFFKFYLASFRTVSPEDVKCELRILITDSDKVLESIKVRIL